MVTKLWQLVSKMCFFIVGATVKLHIKKALVGEQELKLLIQYLAKHLLEVWFLRAI